MFCFIFPPLRVDLGFGLPQLWMVFVLRKEKPSDFRPVGFFTSDAFCLASEAFTIISSVIVDGLSILSFGFLPIRVIFSTAFEF